MPDVVLLPSPIRANYLHGEQRPGGKCNAIVGMDDGKTVFCDADVGAGNRFGRYHVCPTHADAPAVLLDHVDGDGDGVLSRRCRKCHTFEPLEVFDAMSDVCNAHPDDNRTGDGRPPTVVDLSSALGTDEVVGGALPLERLCVDDAGMVHVSSETHCLVQGCSAQVECSAGLCGDHMTARSQHISLCVMQCCVLQARCRRVQTCLW